MARLHKRPYYAGRYDGEYLLAAVVIKRHFREEHRGDELLFRSFCSARTLFTAFNLAWLLLWFCFVLFGLEAAFGPLLLLDTPPTPVRVIGIVWLIGWLAFGLFLVRRGLRETLTDLTLSATRHSFVVTRKSMFGTSMTTFSWPDIDAFTYASAQGNPEHELALLRGREHVCIDTSISIADAKRVSEALNDYLHERKAAESH